MGENKFILVLGIIALILSLINVGITIDKLNDLKKVTGYASSDTGTANLTVEANININFSTRTIDWGSGRVNAGESNATLDTGIDGPNNVTRGNWTSNSEGLILANIGNTNVTIEIVGTKTAATFVGGTNPTYDWNFSIPVGNDASSCTGGTATLGELATVNITGSGTKVCDYFNYETGANQVRIDIRLVVPSNAKTGALSDIITATASSSP